MTDTTIKKMDACRHLLPEPGPQVVSECITEIRKLREALSYYHTADFLTTEQQAIAESALK